MHWMQQNSRVLRIISCMSTEPTIQMFLQSGANSTRMDDSHWDMCQHLRAACAVRGAPAALISVSHDAIGCNNFAS